MIGESVSRAGFGAPGAEHSNNLFPLESPGAIEAKFPAAVQLAQDQFVFFLMKHVTVVGVLRALAAQVEKTHPRRAVVPVGFEQLQVAGHVYVGSAAFAEEIIKVIGSAEFFRDQLSRIAGGIRSSDTENRSIIGPMNFVMSFMRMVPLDEQSRWLCETSIICPAWRRA